jgi:hypothetical protein
MGVSTRGQHAKRTQAALLRAVEPTFARLAHLFMREGITSPEAERLLRSACVRQAASIAEGMGDKKLNASWVAFVTGLARKEVARILRVPGTLHSALEGRSHPANKVLEAWHTDRAFVVGGTPRILSFKAAGPSRASFWLLATRYAPDVYPGLLLRELCRIGAVKRLKDGRIQPRMRRYKAPGPSPRHLRRVTPAPPARSRVRTNHRRSEG